jgi:hypothetical protein
LGKARQLGRARFLVKASQVKARNLGKAKQGLSPRQARHIRKGPRQGKVSHSGKARHLV